MKSSVIEARFKNFKEQRKNISTRFKRKKVAVKTKEEKEVEKTNREIKKLVRIKEKLDRDLRIVKEKENKDNKKTKKKKAQLKYDKGALVEKTLGENVDVAFLTGLLVWAKGRNEKEIAALKKIGKQAIEAAEASKTDAE